MARRCADPSPGTSLEILVQTKAGANVNAQTDGNRMQLNIDGKLQPRALEVMCPKSFGRGTTAF